MYVKNFIIRWTFSKLSTVKEFAFSRQFEIGSSNKLPMYLHT